MVRTIKVVTILAIIAIAAGCQTMKPIHTVEKVDLERFMGDWYVIASIPNFIEKDAFNAIESYRLDDDGTVATTFTFNKGSYDGPVKEYNPRGFIRDQQSNAVWGMQFVWPFKAEYRIVWIMARESNIPKDDYDKILNFLRDQDYDITNLRLVPHGSNR
jgi:apolipoprotein D and lipocalin family protein